MIPGGYKIPHQGEDSNLFKIKALVPKYSELMVFV